MRTSIRILATGLASLVLSGVVNAQDDLDCAKCVDASDIASEAITTYKIKPRAVTGQKLAAQAVTTSKLAPKAVTTSKIANEAISGNKIQAGAVTPDKITGTDLLYNTQYGMDTLISNTTGDSNTAIGPYVLYSNTEGYANTAVGGSALWQNTVGRSNTAYGVATLWSNIDGHYNIAVGDQALYNSTGSNNTAIGFNALIGATGSNNTAVGYSTLRDVTTGENNIALGFVAGIYNTGSNNITIGNPGLPEESSTIRIGNNQARTFLAGIRGTTTGSANAVNVVIDSAGQLGTISSSARYKQDIDDMGAASERLLQLRPVTFRYRDPYESGEQPLKYGLIAEEVAEVFPELVVFNEDSEPETVKYRLLSSLLLNELQKVTVELEALNTRIEELESAKHGAIAQID